jgi:hypothetical protein
LSPSDVRFVITSAQTVPVPGASSVATNACPDVVTAEVPPAVKSEPVYVRAVGVPSIWNDAPIDVKPAGCVWPTRRR